jgi:tetratricopeptide (TPR) repeat protein
MKIAFLTILTFILAGCNNYTIYKNKPANKADILINERLEADHPNLKPMYGGEIKSEEEKEIDNKFISEVLQKYKGDTVKAAKESARDGWYYFYKEIIDTAMFRFNQSWLIDKNYPASYFGFAAIREYQGITVEAEIYYQLAYKHDTSDSLTNKYLHQIAEIREKQKDTLGLINSYYRVLSLFAKDGISTGKLGFFYSVLNMPDSALKYYNLTIEYDPDYDQTYINRGWLYFQNHKTKEAIADYTTAIDKNIKSISAYANRASILMLDKQYEKAIPDIKQCILLDPKYPDFHSALAECYFELNQNDEGCNELNIGIQKGGRFSDLKNQHSCK